MTTLLGDTAAVTSRPANRPAPKLLITFGKRKGRRRRDEVNMLSNHVCASQLNSYLYNLTGDKVPSTVLY
jgi:hypothetical protein